MFCDGQTSGCNPVLFVTHSVCWQECVHIALPVLFSYMVRYTIDTALENRNVALNGVCANEHVPLFASIDLPRMANRAVTAEIFLYRLRKKSLSSLKSAVMLSLSGAL